ncbi:DUF1735 domain-containing protein [uncultured Proteiniphilum sp.]|uniref:DUF1735 domain-containing protein n=1 Tax=uncultured Proteiniphilum sp. TaxID=497637 RepID=UPI002629846E|nr:DUF1735 domain-containing protein [uncultured Proteiniphilum sp.]
MKNINNILVVLIILLMGMLSCDNDEIFEMEQYKNVFALISETDNIYSKFYDLREPESVGYLSASCGGTNPTKKDINISLVEDPLLIEAYNKTNFDVEYNKYAHALSKSRYDIDSYHLRIPAGEIKSSLPIRIRPEGLSPDSTYFIPLRIDLHDSYEANPEKSYVLFEIRIKNFYAKANGTTYNLVGKEQERSIFGTKIMHPLGGNKVRIMAGTEAYLADIEVHKKYALVLEISEEGKVHIIPYGDIQVNQIDDDPEYPNIFKVNYDGYRYYKTFLLRYDFTIGDNTYRMSEELRLQFDPENEDEQ